MVNVLIEMLAAFASCVGFSVIYQTRPKRLFWCGFGAAITWGICRLTECYTDNLFINYLLAAAFGTIVSEILARHTKTPATVYLIPTLLPMVPGGSLYYTTFAIVAGNHADARYYGQRTALAALGIAVGLVIVSVVVYYYNEYKHLHRDGPFGPS